MLRFLKSLGSTSTPYSIKRDANKEDNEDYVVKASLSKNLVDPKDLKAENPTKHKKNNKVYFVESGIVSSIYIKDGKKVYKVVIIDDDTRDDDTRDDDTRDDDTTEDDTGDDDTRDDYTGEIELNFYGNSLMTKREYENMFIDNSNIHEFDWSLKSNNDDKSNNEPNDPYAYMRQDYSDIEKNLIDPTNRKVREHMQNDEVYFIRHGIVKDIGHDIDKKKIYEVEVPESVKLKYFYGNHLMTEAEYKDKFFGIPKPTKVGGSRRRRRNKSRSRRQKKSTRRRRRKH